MKILTDEQRSEGWFSARNGIPTASRFKDIITSQGKKSASFGKLANTLAAERLMGHGVETFQSEWMARGAELEPQACAWYEFQMGRTVEHVGLCLLDNESAGASPDGLMADRGLEIKCPAPHTHIAYLASGKLPSEYIPQVQGSMWICERDAWDFVSFHPEMPPLLVEVKRDDQFIATLCRLVKELHERVAEIVDTIERRAA